MPQLLVWELMAGQRLQDLEELPVYQSVVAMPQLLVQAVIPRTIISTTTTSRIIIFTTTTSGTTMCSTITSPTTTSSTTMFLMKRTARVHPVPHRQWQQLWLKPPLSAFQPPAQISRMPQLLL